MNNNPAIKPSVDFKREADFATHLEWEQDLIDRITVHFKWQIHNPPHKNTYEIDQNIDLKDVDSEKINALLLGQRDLAEDGDDDWDNLYEHDVEVIKEVATNIFKLYKDEIEALAVASDRDAYSIKEKWLESEQFSTEETGSLHFNKKYYQGEVSAHFKLPFDLTLDPMGDDLWNSLTFFRINASDFLSAARHTIGDTAFDYDGKINESSLDALEPWGLSFDDIEDSDAADQFSQHDAVEIYTSKFLERQLQMETAYLSSWNKWAPNESALTPESLFAYIKEHSYKRNHDIPAYLQLCLDGDTVETFSERCQRHSAYDDHLPVSVQTGYLTQDEYPGYSKDYAGTVKILNPVTVALGSIKINQESSPERGGSDILLLPASLELYDDLYEALVLKRKKTLPLDLTVIEDVKALDEALTVIKGKPRSMVTAALAEGNLCGFDFHAARSLAQSASMFDQDELDRTLLDKFEALTPEVMHQHELKELEHLLAIGARCDYVNAMGANALHLAAKRLVPLRLLDAVGRATDQLDKEIAEQGNAFELTVKALSSKGMPLLDASKEDCKKRLAWLLDHSIGLTAKALEYPKPGVLTHLERLDDGGIMVAALNRLAEEAPADEIQRVKDRMFYNSAIKGNESLARHLVTAGAQVDAVSRALPEPCNIEDAIDKFGHKHNYDPRFPDRKDAIKAMARANRLRNSALSLINEMENDASELAGMRP